MRGNSVTAKNPTASSSQERRESSSEAVKLKPSSKAKTQPSNDKRQGEKRAASRDKSGDQCSPPLLLDAAGQCADGLALSRRRRRRWCPSRAVCPRTRTLALATFFSNRFRPGVLSCKRPLLPVDTFHLYLTAPAFVERGRPSRRSTQEPATESACGGLVILRDEIVFLGG